MKIQTAERMKEYEEGIFQVLNDKKNELIQSGRRVYNFSIGTPDFPPAKHIVNAVSKAAKNPNNFKYSLEDRDELLEAVQYRFRNRYGVELEKNEIVGVYGSQEGMAHVGLSLCDAGDIVMVPNPGYPIFSIGPSLAGAKIVPYNLLPENDYLPDLDHMDEEFLKKVKFMIVSYPLNPICKTAPKSFYEKLIPWAIKHEIIILHDNAYSDIVYDGKEGISILSIPGAKDICAEFYSLSKSYNFTGARMAFLVGNSQIVQGLKKLRSQIDYGSFLPVQYGAIAALTGTDKYVKQQCAEYQRRRDALCGGLRDIGWNIPDSQGTMFAWGAIPEGYTDDKTFVIELMEKTGVICTPGSSFGSLGEGHVRFALVLPVEEIEEAIASIVVSKILTNS